VHIEKGLPDDFVGAFVFVSIYPLDILIQILHDENQDYGMLFIVGIVL